MSACPLTLPRHSLVCAVKHWMNLASTAPLGMDARSTLAPPAAAAVGVGGGGGEGPQPVPAIRWRRLMLDEGSAPALSYDPRMEG